MTPSLAVLQLAADVNHLYHALPDYLLDITGKVMIVGATWAVCRVVYAVICFWWFLGWGSYYSG
jgi:hypothetical protein